MYMFVFVFSTMKSICIYVFSIMKSWQILGMSFCEQNTLGYFKILIKLYLDYVPDSEDSPLIVGLEASVIGSYVMQSCIITTFRHI